MENSETDYSKLSKSPILLVWIVKIQAARTKKASNTSAVLPDLSIWQEQNGTFE